MTSFPPLKDTFKSEVTPTSLQVHDASKLPSLPLPGDLKLPQLPSPPRDPSSFFPGYSVSTHLVPGAYPRYGYLSPRRALPNGLQAAQSGSVPQSTNPTAHIAADDAPPDSVGRSVKKAWAEERRNQLVDGGWKILDMWGELSESDVEQWVKDAVSRGDTGPATWSVVNRYARVLEPSGKEGRDKRTGLTLFAWHANGMHKETYEPVLKRLIELCDAPQSPVRIDEVWSFDASNTGDGALVNAGKIEDYTEWVDDVRDLFSFIDNYLPSTFTQSKLPIHIPRLDERVAERRVMAGVEGRILMGIGHSFGGCVIANAACRRPNIFKSLTLIEPVLFHTLRREQTFYVVAALSRRSHWESREEAKKVLRKNPALMGWHPESLDAFVRYAICDAPPGGVKLKMSPFQEAVSFAHGTLGIETWDLLERLLDSVRLRWIMAEHPGLGTVEDMNHMVWRRLRNSSNVIVKKSHHLVLQEQPDAVARATYGDWKELFGSYSGAPAKL
ncbi:hypothetical protein DL93DRAFT_2162583 [Clavulina sp. PMI_390]|nr:hypothetical protein DL93DRAFT_2162583 [Clavulina sp. PMI_390]